MVSMSVRKQPTRTTYQHSSHRYQEKAVTYITSEPHLRPTDNPLKLRRSWIFDGRNPPDQVFKLKRSEQSILWGPNVADLESNISFLPLLSKALHLRSCDGFEAGKKEAKSVGPTLRILLPDSQVCGPHRADKTIKARRAIRFQYKAR